MWEWIKRYLKKHCKETRPEGLTVRDYRILLGKAKPTEPRREDRPAPDLETPKDASFLEIDSARSIRGFADNGVRVSWSFNDQQLARWWEKWVKKLKRKDGLKCGKKSKRG